MKIVKNPHDLYFKEVMSKVENAQSFLEYYLSDDIKLLLDIEHLEISKDSFIDEDLEEHFSDMLYYVPLKESETVGNVYILLEHKSYGDPWVALQILEYMVQCWKTARIKHIDQLKKDKQDGKDKNHSKFQLPVVIPIVVYHGPGTWSYGNKSIQMFDCSPIFKQFMPDFSYILYDLINLKEDQINGSPSLRIMMQLFKFIRTPELKDKLTKILHQCSKEIPEQNVKATISTLIYYLLNACDIETKELKNIIEDHFHGGDAVMTTAEKLISQGEIKGKIEGETKGKIKGKIEANLEIKFGDRGLDCMEKIEPLDDLEKLQRIFMLAKKAPGIEAFESELGLILAEN